MADVDLQDTEFLSLPVAYEEVMEQVENCQISDEFLHEPFYVTNPSNILDHEAEFNNADEWETDDELEVESVNLPRNIRPVKLKPVIEDEPLDLREALVRWTVKNSVNFTKVDDLLAILKTFTHHNNLPKTARTLLKTDKIKPNVQKKSNFEFHIFDVRHELKSALNALKDVDKLPGILLMANWDGASFFKSSKNQAWPFLLSIYNIQPKIVIMGMFCYGIVPKDLSFMNPLMHQINELVNEGLEFNGRTIKVQLSAIVCDLPARAKIRGHKNFNGFSSCHLCWHRGTNAGGGKQ